MERPDFDTALVYWQNLIQEKGFSPNLRWVFRENLYHTRHENTESFRLVFETEIHPVTLKDVRSVYEKVRPQECPIVFELLVHAQDFTLCTLLGDEFGIDEDTFVEEWNLYFSAQDDYLSFEELSDPTQWAKGKIRQWRHISGLDFVFCLDGFRPNPNGIVSRLKQFIQRTNGN